MAAVVVHSSQLEGRLLRMDPSAIRLPSALTDHAIAAGRPLFEQQCSQCHGRTGAGDPRRGIPDLTDEDWLYGTGSVADIEQVIRYGIRSHHAKSWNLALMPAYATPHPSARDPAISPWLRGGIAGVIEARIERQGGAADANAAVCGARVFLGAGGCYDCNAADAKGDTAIGAPNLTDGITLYGDGSRAALRASIEQGRHGMCPAFEGRLPAAALRELAVYVYTLSHARGGK